MVYEVVENFGYEVVLVLWKIYNVCSFGFRVLVVWYGSDKIIGLLYDIFGRKDKIYSLVFLLWLFLIIN